MPNEAGAGRGAARVTTCAMSTVLCVEHGNIRIDQVPSQSGVGSGAEAKTERDGSSEKGTFWVAFRSLRLFQTTQYRMEDLSQFRMSFGDMAIYDGLPCPGPVVEQVDQVTQDGDDGRGDRDDPSWARGPAEMRIHHSAEPLLYRSKQGVAPDARGVGGGPPSLGELF